MGAPEGEDGLYSEGVSVVYYEGLFVMLADLVVRLVHVDIVGDCLIGPPASEVVSDCPEGGQGGQLQLIVLDVFVEGEHLGLGRRVVRREEGEVEVVLFDGHVEDETNPAHSN
jgi:hypothetical protein